MTWNGSLLHPAQLFLDLLCCACLFCPHQVFCGHFLPLLLACFMAGAIGKALVILPRWQSVSPVHTLGSRWMILHDMTLWQIPGWRGRLWEPHVCMHHCGAEQYRNSTTNHSSGSKPSSWMHARPLATQDKLPLCFDSDLVPLMAFLTTRLLFWPSWVIILNTIRTISALSERASID